MTHNVFLKDHNKKEVSGNVKKKKSIFKDIIQVGGWVLKAFSKIF